MPHDRQSLSRRALLGTAAAGAALVTTGARAAPPPAPGTMELVATFNEPHQVTGVAVSPKGRIFVNFPRWEQDVAISVAEVGPGGKLTPFPDAGWNAYRNAKTADPAKSFVCVQSVTCDPQGNLWILDPAAPALGFTVPGGPKLLKVDLATNQVSRVYAFDEAVAPQGSYLNDIRFTPDGQRAVLTNSGQPGALVVLDVATGQARTVLRGHPSTQFEKGLVVSVPGKRLVRLDGATAQFSADGLAIDPKGEFVYWQATTGTTMYRAPLKALFDPAMSPDQLGGAVETYVKTFITDGYFVSAAGAFYLTSPGDNTVKQMMPDRSFRVVAKDSRLNWPDSMAEGPGGWIYVTGSHIPDMKAWQGPGVSQSQLFRFKPA